MLLKKQVSSGAVEKMESEIFRLRQMIEERKEASKGTKEGRDQALKVFKNYRSNTLNAREECFYMTNHVKLLRATGYAGEITALNFVISVLENPDDSTFIFRSQLTQLEKNLEALKKLPLQP